MEPGKRDVEIIVNQVKIRWLISEDNDAGGDDCGDVDDVDADDDHQMVMMVMVIHDSKKIIPGRRVRETHHPEADYVPTSGNIETLLATKFKPTSSAIDKLFLI